MKPEITADMSEREVFDLQDGWHGTDDAKSPLGQWLALKELEEYGKAYGNGDESALMWAIHTCFKHGLVAPAWLAAASIERINDVHNFRQKSWDDVFPPPLPKGKQIAAARVKQVLMLVVFGKVQENLNTGCPIDDPLFEEIGKELIEELGEVSPDGISQRDELGIPKKFGGKTQIKQLYYDAVKFFPKQPID